MTLTCALGFLIIACCGALLGIGLGSRIEAKGWRESAERGTRRISRGQLYTITKIEWSPVNRPHD
jgi:hypothetical protein